MGSVLRKKDTGLVAVQSQVSEPTSVFKVFPSLGFKVVREPCIYHQSVIQNFFSGEFDNEDDTLFVKRYTPTENIEHARTNRTHIRDLPVEEIVKRFLRWKEKYHSTPTILHAHGFNIRTGQPIYGGSEGKQWEKTWQALTRFHSNRNIWRLSKALEKSHDYGVFLTLTVDRSKSLRESWETIMKDWNRFLARLKYEIKKGGGKHWKNLKYVGVLEAQADGYPHIHIVFLGIKWLFYAGNKRDWEMDNPHSKNLKHFWKRGSVFVNATKDGKTVRNPINYLFKYIRKTFGSGKGDDKRELTQAMLWAFNRRSFFLSRSMSNWVKKVVPEEPKKVDWKLHGMAKTEFWVGQNTPIVRIITRKLPEGHPAVQPAVSPLAVIDGVVGEIISRDQMSDYLYHRGKILRFHNWAIHRMKKMEPKEKYKLDTDDDFIRLFDT